MMKKALLLPLLVATLAAQQPTKSKPKIVGTPVNCHTIRVVAVAYSADGTRALSASMDNDVIIWDARKGRRVRRIDCKSEPTSAAFAGAKNERVAITRREMGETSAALMLFDAAKGKLLKTVTGFNSVCATPDQAKLVGMSTAGEVVVLDAMTCAEEARFAVGERLYQPSFTPDGKFLLVDEYMKGKTYIVDLAAKKVVKDVQLGRFKSSRGVTEDGKFLMSVSSIKITKRSFPACEELDSWRLGDGPTSMVPLSESEILFGDMSGAVVKLDLAAGKFVFTKGEHRSVVNCLTLSPDRKTVMSGSWDGVVRFWDVATGDERFLAEDHNNAATTVAFAPDGKSIASGSWDNSVVLRTAKGKVLGKSTAHEYAATAVAAAADGSWWSASQDGTVRHWAKDGKELGKLSYADGETYATQIALLHGGKKVVVGMSDGNLRWIDAATHEEELRVDAHDGPIVGLVAADDGTFVATGGDTTVCTWREGAEKPTQTVAVEGLQQMTGLNGVVIASAKGGVLVRIDGKSGKETHRIKTKGDVGSFDCVPGHDLVACAIENVEWFSLSDLKAAGQTKAVGTIYCLAASADGRQLVAGLEDSTLSVWKLSTPRKRR